MDILTQLKGAFTTALIRQKPLFFTCPQGEKYSSINIRRRDIFMWYWIVMFILIAGSIGMLGVSFSSIKKNKAIAAAREESGGRRRRRRG